MHDYGSPFLQPWFEDHLPELVGSLIGAPQMMVKLKVHHGPSLLAKYIQDMLRPHTSLSTFPQAQLAYCGSAFVDGLWLMLYRHSVNTSLLVAAPSSFLLI